MNGKKVENYILSKRDVVKTMIPRWRYVRYTVYSSPFASIGETSKGIYLTVLGRYPQYERLYEKIILPAVDNDPKHYSSIDLTVEMPLDEVWKAMIDESYHRRRRAVPMPQIAEGRGDIPYCGIMPAYSEKRAAPPEVIRAISHAEMTATDTYEYGIGKLTKAPNIEMTGYGFWDELPYASAADETEIRKYIRAHKKEK